jgi:NADH:ubiquinone reductase (H+-translocating)
MPLNIPNPEYKRIVIVGGGFGGLMLARKLVNTKYQIILVDKNNYHQFPPLFYQVAMAGLEPSSIVFPFRKLFQKVENVLFRVAELQSVDYEGKYIYTNNGKLRFDYLVLALGTDTNYYGNANIAEHTIPMKSVAEALYLRNAILSDYEKALLTNDVEEQQSLMDIVIVGGGPTGVEIAGALAEMKRDVLPIEYSELQCNDIDYYLIQSGNQLLKGMSDNAAKTSEKFLTDLGVKIIKNARVTDYDGKTVTMDNGQKIQTLKVIWAAGVTSLKIEGLNEDDYGFSNRLKVDETCKLENYENFYCIGDNCIMHQEHYPEGHPQVAQVAIQQAKFLADHLKRLVDNRPTKKFQYKDLGAMATIGRHKAVVDFPKWQISGFFAWLIWLFIHLISIMGVKNKVFIFLNWLWSYFTYDQALRLIIKPSKKGKNLE